MTPGAGIFQQVLRVQSVEGALHLLIGRNLKALPTPRPLISFNPLKICIVTAELAGPSSASGVGASCYHLAKSLALSGFEVEILFCARECREDLNFHVWQCFYQSEGIRLVSIKPRGILLDNQPSQQMSHLIYETLKSRDFDLLIFSGVRGLGFFCTSAKKSGLYFQNTQIWSLFERPTEWDFEQNEKFISRAMDLPDLYMEKQSFLLSDKILCFSKASAGLANSLGFVRSPEQLIVARQPYANSAPRRQASRQSAPKEICYFGRRDLRRGFSTFLIALALSKKQILANNIKVTLLGPPDRHSKTEQDDLKQWILENGVPINLVTGKNYFHLLEYLKKNRPTVVLPSVSDASGAAIVDCIENDIPFICSSIELFKEIVGGYKLIGVDFFPPGSARALSGKILAAIDRRKVQRFVQKPQDRRVFSTLITKSLFPKGVSDVRARKPSKSKRCSVSVCITHRDRGNFLLELMSSLEPIMQDIGEVLVYDDCSALRANQLVLRRLEKKYDKLRVLRGRRKMGPSHGRNTLAATAKSDYLLFIDDDNILNAGTFEKVLPLLDGSIDFLAAPLSLFDNETRSSSSPLIPDRLSSIWSPIGAGLAMNIINNHIGDANMIMKREFFHKIGGFSEDLTWGEDIEILVRASFMGGKYHFFTESFVYYRDHKNGLSKQVDSRLGRRRMWKRLLKNLGMDPELHQFLNLFGTMAEALKDQEAEKRPIIRNDIDVGEDIGFTHYYPPLVSLYRTDLYFTTPDALVPNLDFVLSALTNVASKYKNIVMIKINSKSRSKSRAIPTFGKLPKQLILSFDVISSDYCTVKINKEIEARLEKGSTGISLRMSSTDRMEITSDGDVETIYVCNVQIEDAVEKVQA